MFHFALYRWVINTKHAFHVVYSCEGEGQDSREIWLQQQ